MWATLLPTILTLGFNHLSKAVARPLPKSNPEAPSRTLLFGGTITTLGFALAIASALGEYNWAELIGPTWGGVLTGLIGFAVLVLRHMTTGPVRS